MDFTVGDLRAALIAYPDDHKLSFDAGLTFSRTKNWADDEVLILFEEYQAMLSEKFRNEFPEVKVAFCHAPDMEGEMIKEVGIPEL